MHLKLFPWKDGTLSSLCAIPASFYRDKCSPAHFPKWFVYLIMFTRLRVSFIMSIRLIQLLESPTLLPVPLILQTWSTSSKRSASLRLFFILENLGCGACMYTPRLNLSIEKVPSHWEGSCPEASSEMPPEGAVPLRESSWFFGPSGTGRQDENARARDGHDDRERH